MAILEIEGFDAYSGGSTAGERTQVLNQLKGKYQSAGTTGDNFRTVSGHNSPTGMSGGRIGQAAAIAIDIPTDNEVYLSFSFRYNTKQPNSSGARLAEFRLGGTVQASLAINNGEVLVKRSTSSTLQTTSSTPITTDVWYQVEIHLVCDNSGSWEVKLDGTTILSGSGDTQQHASLNDLDGVWFFMWPDNVGTGDQGITEIDNVVIQDAAGGFLGEWRIEGLQPSGAGSQTDFTPSAGSNYENVDEVPPDDDTTYNESSTNGHRDLYAYDNLAALGGGESIAAVQVNTIAKQSGGEDVSNLIRSGGTTYTETPQTLAAGYGTRKRLEEQNPNTSGAWSEAAVNAAEFGLEVSV
jgi:hypothetical protein